MYLNFKSRIKISTIYLSLIFTIILILLVSIYICNNQQLQNEKNIIINKVVDSVKENVMTSGSEIDDLVNIEILNTNSTDVFDSGSLLDKKGLESLQLLNLKNSTSYILDRDSLNQGSYGSFTYILSVIDTDKVLPNGYIAYVTHMIKTPVGFIQPIIHYKENHHFSEEEYAQLLLKVENELNSIITGI